MNFLKKIFGKLRFYSSCALLRLAAALRSAKLAAAVMDAMVWRVPEKAPAGRLPRVLCLGRTIFADDIRALARYSGRIEYVVVHLTYFEQIFQHFFTKAERAGITEENYHHDDTTMSGKNAYTIFIRSVLGLLRRKFGVAGVMSGNFGYVVQQGVQAACAAEHWPFIVLHKEGLVGFGGAEFAAPYQRFRFPGDKVLLYNEVAKKTLLASNMPGLTADKIEVVGMPRLDAYFRHRVPQGNRRQVVLFSFSAADRFHYITDPKLLREIDNLSRDFHRFAMEFAAKYPDTSVTIKTKNARHYIDYVEAIRQEAFPASLPNLTITNAGKAMDLIQRSMAVLGYNSTTLIESLLTGKPAISPDFSDLIPPHSTDFFEDYPDLLCFAHSAAELEKFILHPEARPVSPARRDEFLRAYLHIPDGRASERAEAAILSVMRPGSKEGRDA